MVDLAKRVRWAASRNLTMANLFENLSRIYGEARAMDVASSLICKNYPGGGVSHVQALRFTNLAAEALIAGINLVKGERVLVMTEGGDECFLLAAAVIKAGGVVVPVPGARNDEELAYLVSSCGVKAALVHPALWESHPGVREALGGKARVLAVGTEQGKTGGLSSLAAAMEGASGFFLPYTLKPSNVALLCGVKEGHGLLRAVMVTNRGLISPARTLSPLLPARVGDLCLVCSPPDKPSLYAAVVLALAAGMRLRFCFSSEAEAPRGKVEEERPAAILGYPHDLCRMAERYFLAEKRALPKLWVSAGSLEEAGVLFDYLRERGVPYSSPWLVETFSAGENATIAGLRITHAGRRRRTAFLRMVIPPNRMRCVRDDGSRARKGEEGELVIRGPAVTPGYWNDLEATFRNWRDGWLHTGLRGTGVLRGTPGGRLA